MREALCGLPCHCLISFVWKISARHADIVLRIVRRSARSTAAQPNNTKKETHKHMKINANNYAAGIICALAGGIMWGFSGCCAQVLTQLYGVSSLLLVLLRMPISAVVFLGVMLLFYREKLCAIFSDARTLKKCATFGCIGLFPCQLTYVVAIQLTNAGTGTMLEQFSIVIIMVVACIFARKLPCVHEVLGLICAFGAVVLIATKGDISTLQFGGAIGAAGLLWGLGAAVATTIYVMYPAKLFDKWGSFAVTGVGTMAGGCLCLIVWGVIAAWCAMSGNAEVRAALELPALDAFGWLMMFVTIFIGTFLAFVLYLRGVHIVGRIRGSQLGASEPAAAAVISSLWLGVPFTWADWLGLILMIVTVFLMSAASKEVSTATANGDDA